jgi:transcriptional regulator with XRE-family HTH domain
MTLRKRLDMTREEFGHRIGVSGRTVYRFENGQQPTTKALLRLAEMSDKAELSAHAALFRATRLTNINARVDKVSTSQRARRVVIEELRHWSETQDQVATVIRDFLEGRRSREHSLELLREYSGMLDSIRDEMQLYIAAADHEHPQSERVREHLEAKDVAPGLEFERNTSTSQAAGRDFEAAAKRFHRKSLIEVLDSQSAKSTHGSLENGRTPIPSSDRTRRKVRERSRHEKS